MFESQKINYTIYFLEITGFLVVLLIFKSLYGKRALFKFAKQFNGRKFYPVLGNGYKSIHKNIFKALDEYIDKFGTPCNVWLSHDYHYITVDPKDVKIILTHPNTVEKNNMYRHIQLLFKDTLILAPAEEWKKNRKLYSKSFSQPMLNSFVPKFHEKSMILLDVLKNADINVFDVFLKYAFDSFYSTTIDVEFNSQTNPLASVIETFEEGQQICGKRLISGYYIPEIIWKYFTPSGRKIMRDYQNVKDIIFEAIEKKRNIYRKHTESESAQDQDTKALPLLHSMLYHGVTDDLICKDMFLFISAAADTSAYTLVHTCTLLGMYPDIQDKVFKEVISTVGYDRQIHQDDLPKLKYTERAILEALRILPVAPIIGRHATSDINLVHTILPKGANVGIIVFKLHRDERIWPDPLKYDPDRFLPEEIAKRDPFAYIPFSAGPRNCIGKTYSMMLMKTCLANVVRNFEVYSSNKSVLEFELESAITLKAVTGLNCTFKPRKYKSLLI